MTQNINRASSVILLIKAPCCWATSRSTRRESGIWDFLHSARLQSAMLCGCVYLFIVGAGIYSADAGRTRGAVPERASAWHRRLGVHVGGRGPAGDAVRAVGGRGGALPHPP